MAPTELQGKVEDLQTENFKLKEKVLQLVKQNEDLTAQLATERAKKKKKTIQRKSG